MNYTPVLENTDNEDKSPIQNDNCENVIRHSMNEASIEADMNLLPINKEKRCCWNCLKVLLEENSISKRFDEKIIKLKVVID